MKKAERMLGWCRAHPIPTNAIVVVLEIIVAVVLWMVGDLVDYFTNVSSYMLFWVTVLLASIATVSSILASMSAHDSLYVANEGLILTRATQRPFLNATVELPRGTSADHAIVQPKVQNTGNLPADDVIITCKWYIQDNNTKREQPLRKAKRNPTIIFPGERAVLTYTIESQEAVAQKTHPGRRFEVTIEYENRLTHRNIIPTEHSNLPLYQ